MNYAIAGVISLVTALNIITTTINMRAYPMTSFVALTLAYSSSYYRINSSFASVVILGTPLINVVKVCYLVVPSNLFVFTIGI